GHRRGTSAHHRQNDPSDLPADSRSLKAVLAQRQQSAGEREGQSENRMLELNHFERQTESFPHAGECLYFTGGTWPASKYLSAYRGLCGRGRRAGSSPLARPASMSCIASLHRAIASFCLPWRI